MFTAESGVFPESNAEATNIRYNIAHQQSSAYLYWLQVKKLRVFIYLGWLYQEKKMPSTAKILWEKKKINNFSAIVECKVTLV